MSVQQIRFWVRDMHRKKMIHIVAWDRTITNNPCIAVYAWGKGKDAKRPAKLSNAERQARLRMRQFTDRVLGRAFVMQDHLKVQ